MTLEEFNREINRVVIIKSSIDYLEKLKNSIYEAQRPGSVYLVVRSTNHKSFQKQCFIDMINKELEIKKEEYRACLKELNENGLKIESSLSEDIEKKEELIKKEQREMCMKLFGDCPEELK